jgi:hypothetical protein
MWTISVSDLELITLDLLLLARKHQVLRMNQIHHLHQRHPCIPLSITLGSEEEGSQGSFILYYSLQLVVNTRTKVEAQIPLHPSHQMSLDRYLYLSQGDLSKQENTLELVVGKAMHQHQA